MGKPALLPFFSENGVVYLKQKIHRDVMKRLKDATSIKSYVKENFVIYEYTTPYSKGKFEIQGENLQIQIADALVGNGAKIWYVFYWEVRDGTLIYDFEHKQYHIYWYDNNHRRVSTPLAEDELKERIFLDPKKAQMYFKLKGRS
jgi:hypothetical protein